jgi:hypothetical protein
LNRFGKVFEEFVEGGSGRNLHLLTFKKLGKGLPFSNATLFMVFF